MENFRIFQNFIIYDDYSKTQLNSCLWGVNQVSVYWGKIFTCGRKSVAKFLKISYHYSVTSGSLFFGGYGDSYFSFQIRVGKDKTHLNF